MKPGSVNPCQRDWFSLTRRGRQKKTVQRHSCAKNTNKSNQTQQHHQSPQQCSCQAGLCTELTPGGLFCRPGWRLRGRLGYYLTWRQARVRCFDLAWEIEGASFTPGDEQLRLFMMRLFCNQLIKWTHTYLSWELRDYTRWIGGVQEILCIILMWKCIKNIFTL